MKTSLFQTRRRVFFGDSITYGGEYVVFERGHRQPPELSQVPIKDQAKPCPAVLFDTGMAFRGPICTSLDRA